MHILSVQLHLQLGAVVDKFSQYVLTDCLRLIDDTSAVVVGFCLGDHVEDWTIDPTYTVAQVPFHFQTAAYCRFTSNVRMALLKM